jgi:chromosome segregation ATPase
MRACQINLLISQLFNFMNKYFPSLAALAFLALPFATQAHEVAVNAAAQVNVGGVATTTTAVNVKLEARITDAKDHANREIDRRVASLSALKTRIASITRISANDATVLTTSLDAQISALNSLKGKIASDSTVETLKVDIESIKTSHRIYALVMPQIAITASAERIAGIASAFDQIAATLEAQINAQAQARADLTAALTDLKAKIADANAKIQAAINGIKDLKADAGDKGTQKSNLAALKDAQAKIKVAQQDIVAARKDAGTIKAGLDASASVTATTSAETH